MKKILFTLMACVLCLGLVGGAFAYFTDVETSTSNNMSAGTLEMQIGDNNEGYGDTAVTASFNSPVGLAPGQEFVAGPIYLKNVGTIDIMRIYARFGNYQEFDNGYTDPEGPGSANNIGDYLKLLYYAESPDNGTTWYYETFETGLPEGGQGTPNAHDYLQYWIDRGAPITNDDSISLLDLAIVRNYGSGDMHTSLVMLDGGNAPGPLAPNAAMLIKFKFRLIPSTPNAIQSDSATFDVNFIASQVLTYPDDLLFDSITEPLVP